MLNVKLNLERMRRKALLEIERASNRVSVWIITKGGDFCGRITLRWKKHRQEYVAHIAFFMYAIKDSLIPVGATINMYGFGYDKCSSGIGEIFKTLKPQLSEYFGINFECPDWDIMNKWQSAFREAGYEIFRAL